MRKPNTRKTAAPVSDVPTFPIGDGNSPAQTETAIVALNTAPQAGSNSAVEGEVLISVEAAHDAIAEVLAAMADSETKLEYARQKLAYDLWLRHNAMQAVAPSGEVPMLQDLAGVRNRTKFHTYLNALVVEFSGPMLSKAKCTTNDLMRAYNLQQKVYARVSRSLELIVHLAFMGLNTSSFDVERGQWRILPAMLITAGFKGSDDLTSQPFIYLEADTRDEYYFISKPRQAAKAVAPSLTHVAYAMYTIIEAAHNPAAPTPEDAKRTPRQPVAKSGDTPADAPATDTASDDDEPGMDADKPANETERSWVCRQYAAAVNAAAKWVNHPGMVGATKDDVGTAAYNSSADIATLYDRMRDAEERKDSKLAA
jgi:hypothetical protein